MKSFYASVELVSRGCDPLSTHLVVADESRTEKTICLAVSPSLKAYGISGRARLFEVVQRVQEVNAERFRRAKRLGALPRNAQGEPCFSSASFDAEALAADPSLELSYLVAPPRMKLYQEISTKVYSVYLRYIAAEDIHVYSIDECFLDVTGYLDTYGMDARELTMTMIREVLYETGITATAGIGSNLYLAKVAMDIVAKHVPADRDGVRIAALDERTYRELLWCHRPITDFWRVGRGIARRLAELGCYTMGDVARLSVHNEGLLYDRMGVNAELLIDHAWGWEPTRISAIKAYRPETKSLSSGQVLPTPYDWEKGRLAAREMAELLALDLVRKGLVTRQLTLTLGYDRESLRTVEEGGRTVYLVSRTGAVFHGAVTSDPYGRPCPRHAHGTGNLPRWTSGTRAIVGAVVELYERIADRELLVRRLYVNACGLIPEEETPLEEPLQFDLFTDWEAQERREAAERAAAERERRLQKATLRLQARFGKNAVLKGMNLLEGGTTITRNGQIGGHRSGEDSGPKRGREERK